MPNEDTPVTSRLALRRLVPDDAEAVFLACQDADIQRWTTIPSPYERAHAEFFLRRTVGTGRLRGTMHHFAVEPRAGGPLLGAVNVHDEAGGWEVGYWAAREYRGHGYVTEAVLALAHWAFTTLGASRLGWQAETGNAGSRAVAERVGFTIEGIRPAALINKGVVRDVWTGVLLPSDLGPAADAAKGHAAR